MNFKRAFVSTVATTAALGGVMLGAASSADAATYGCGSSGHNNSDGVHKVVVGHLRNGPSESCAQTMSVVPGTTFYAWCGVYNKYGNLWVYGRLAGGESKGWIYSQNLTKESGAVNVC